MGTFISIGYQYFGDMDNINFEQLYCFKQHFVCRLKKLSVAKKGLRPFLKLWTKKNMGTCAPAEDVAQQRTFP